METIKSSSYSKEKPSSKHSSSKESSSKSKKSSKHRHHRDDPSSSEENGSKRKYEHSEDEVNSDSDMDRNKNHHKRSHKDDRSSRKHRTDEKSNKNEESTNGKSNSGGGGGDISLSIEETNKLREKLGLKPLTDHKASNDNKKSADGKKTYIDQDTNQEFEHVPAKNLADIRDQKEIRHKLQEQKEKRLLVEKLRNAKGLADSDEEDNSASSWLIKIKQKEDAQKKAKLLQEMDEQFEEEAALTKKPVTKETRTKKYDENDLTGLRVEHDQSFFKEGQEIILTLKDRNILKGTGDNADVDDDEEADVLVNVNIMDDERANKNIENKKKKPDYRAYDEFDEDGVYKEKSILDKYNEELNGETKKSFKLGTHGTYDASDDKFIERLNQEHKARAIKIDALNELKLATDYMTTQEMEKFKKPKKVRKVLRKNKMMKADDLLATAPEPTAAKQKKVKQEDEFLDKIVKKEPEDEAKVKTANKISLKDIDFGFSKNKSEDEDGEYEEEDEDDDIDVNKLKHNEIQELKQIQEDENNALDELHSVLSKTRKRVTSSILRSNQIKEEITENNVYETKTNGVAFENLNTVVEYTEDDRALTLDSLSEFCRNLGHTSSSTRTEKIEKEEEEDDEEEVKMEMEKSHEKDESSDEEDVINTTKEMVAEAEDEEGFDLLDEEPLIDRGLASCLQLAVNKGYIDVEKSKQNARFNKASIEAVNYTVEEKNYYDIDDKYNRNRDRFSGPLSDFQEKSNYKPDVKLDYIDEKGHAMNEKEAFRYLSHRFHGKGSGKKKTEKQNKKFKEMEVMNKMSSVDTPLNTVALLVEKQKKLQQPFVVLSTSKNKQDQVTLHKR